MPTIIALLAFSLIIINRPSVVHVSNDAQDAYSEEIQDVDCTNPQSSEDIEGCQAMGEL